MVRNPESNNGAFPNILQLFFSTSLLQVIGVALVLIVVAAHIIWLSERHHKDGMIPKSYFPGIFKACWWAAATLATQADEMPKGVMGRLVGIVWMFIGVLFAAYFTASATTSLTVQQLQGDIRSIDDLPGKVVATTAGSTAATYLREHKISVLEVTKIEQAYNALQTKKADAVVFDAPVLLFYAANEGKGKVQIVGSILREESYGIILPNNSPYRKPINQALLSLKENGTYQSLYDKWFDAEKFEEGSGDRGLGTGDWGLGTGDWGLGRNLNKFLPYLFPIPSTKSLLSTPFLSKLGFCLLPESF
ncbi:transporter substrate-binding domain-containing protein [Nostoc sp. 'Peltigera malacea cyanobiont' DB3992]|uniref:transporter substrate-binding domain-containing protein n=1 Tax=Nostoc sp. 'Peltigera malacea cyanobiont' DB3992 TaxID=1206980 RepID=UPI0027B8B0B5|nr:transporter substrate-binding domain-containing protein [Nostoc sp. 'Peltigera malacea cyanobiont' DB3992]